MLKVRNLMFAAALALVAVPAVSAQSTDEVLDRYYEAIGGADSWKNLQSMRATGTLDVMGGMMTGPFTIVQKRPAMARIEMSMQGMQIVQAFDGETAWQIMPMLGTSDPMVADSETAQQIIEQADMDGPLIGWQEDGYTIEFEGMETMDGAETAKLKVTAKDGLVTHYYLDENYLPVKMVSVRPIQGVETALTTTLADYQSIGGLMFPFLIEIDTPMGVQELAFDSIEVNVDVDESVFSMSGK